MKVAPLTVGYADLLGDPLLLKSPVAETPRVCCGDEECVGVAVESEGVGEADVERDSTEEEV